MQPPRTRIPFRFPGCYLQFCRAAETGGLIKLEWNEDVGDYLVEAA